MDLSEACLGQNTVYARQRLFQALEQRAEESLQPGRDVQGAFLAGFEDAVVAGAVVEDAGRYGVEANGLLLALQRQVGDGTRQSTVAIKGVQGGEPEMGNAGA